MSVTYLITFAVKPTERERFLHLLGGVLDAMRGEATFENATLHVDLAEPNHFLLHETWTDHQDVVDVQLGQPYRRDWHDALPDLLEQPRAVSMWTPLRRDVSDAGR